MKRLLLLAAAAITNALDVQDVAYAVITSSPVAKDRLPPLEAAWITPPAPEASRSSSSATRATTGIASPSPARPVKRACRASPAAPCRAPETNNSKLVRARHGRHFCGRRRISVALGSVR